MIIASLLILGASLLFLTIAVVAVLFQIVLPMREQLADRPTAIPSEEIEAMAKRATEIEIASRTHYMDARGDIIHLSRRVDELEILAYDRPTKPSA